ncbi:MAG: sugar-binding protein, partial [bacterium]
TYLVRAYDECSNYSLYSSQLAVVAPKILKYTAVKNSSEIKLDGKPDEDIWNKAVWDTASIYKIDPSNDAEETIPEEQDLHSIFAITWDEDYLYVFVDVSDASVNNWDGSSNDWPTRNVPYQFDCIELCIAGSNERYVSDAGLKDGDSQWRFNTGVPSTISGNPGNADLNTYNVEFTEGISLRNAGGYTFEIKFPWSAVFRDIDVPADLGEGTELLFMMVTIDNDGRKDGDMFLRDHELAYFDGTGNHWKQTNGYKTMILSGLSSITPDKYNDNQISVYPNPAGEKLFIKSGQAIDYIEIYNGMGQQIKSINERFTGEINISLSEFNKGVYFIKAVDEKGTTSISRFIKL